MRGGMKLRHWIPMLAFAAVLAANASAVPAPPRTGSAAPDFTLPAAQGTVSLTSLKGKVVYVDFWASWCDPCRRSFPWLKAMQEKYGAKGFVVVAVDLDKRHEDGEAFLRKYPAPFTVAFDPAGKVAESFQVAAMPTSFLVGANGTILHQQAGFDPKKTEAVETLIAAACTTPVQ